MERIRGLHASTTNSCEPKTSPPPQPRRWSEKEWEQVLAHLQASGIVDHAEEIILNAKDVQHLLEAAPRKDGRPHFTKANFSRTRFGDAVEFKEAIFDRAFFDLATFGVNAHFVSTIFGHSVSFNQATFGDGAAFVRTRFGSFASFSDASFGHFARDVPQVSVPALGKSGQEHGQPPIP